MIKEKIYFVKGMHCASCEVLIEKKLLEMPGAKSIDASLGKNSVIIEYEGEPPSIRDLNRAFHKEKYVFADQPFEGNNGAFPKIFKDSFGSFAAAVVVMVAFLVLQKTGVFGLLNVTSASSLPAFFVFGLLAGLSSCAALVGGIVLSMSKQWGAAYSHNDSTYRRLQPHLMFNGGRIISYVALGGMLGLLGQKLQISFSTASFLVIVASILMLVIGLQMLGVKFLRRFQFAAPKFITRFVADEKKFHGKYMPFAMGALTFFLPCGFTVTAQSMSLLSGSAVQGALIMGFFSLGTAPMLLLIGASSVKFFSKQHWTERFSKFAAFLIIFFALFNLNSQMNALGYLNLGGIFSFGQSDVSGDLPPIVNGKQIVKMDASSSGYSPSYLKIRAGIPVRWEVTDKGISGCTNAIVARNLFGGQIALSPGETTVREFTPMRPGKYKFSCWMGMVSGTIEVVENPS